MADKCRSCGADIIWAKTPKGKAMPIDAQPNPEGKLALHGGIVVTVGSGPQIGFSDERYISHFGTCPNASFHRRTKQ